MAAFVLAVEIVAPVGFTLSSSVSILPISLSRTPNYVSRVLIPIKNVPAVVTFPLIRSSNIIAAEHATASTLFAASPAFVKPTIPDTKANKSARIKTMVGQ